MWPDLTGGDVRELVELEVERISDLLCRRMADSPGAVGLSVSVWLRRDASGSVFVEVDG